MSARMSLTGLLLVAALLAAAAPAGAEFTPLRLLSKTPTQQADAASAPALSADGRYVAFRALNFVEGGTGVFREDLETGDVTAVATGPAVPAGSVVASAEAPSISADGRYVSFTTKAPLDPVEDPGASTADVYVADLASPSPSYELASVGPGSTEALGGSAAPRVALSADGRELVFVSGGEVFLRDLQSNATTLVSVRRDPDTGAIEPGVPVPGGAVMSAYGNGAALSADGSTVAWLGAHLPDQVPLLADEKEKITALDAGARPYDEPLWRRVADGPSAPTRRIVGGGDPAAPGCPGTSGTLSDPACRGPFPGLMDQEDPPSSITGWLAIAGMDGVPQLSADGREVALIGNPTLATNVFLVDMTAPLSRVQAVRQLTAQVPTPAPEGSKINAGAFVPLNGHVWDVAISADGGRVAFTTARQRFPLAPPNLLGAPPSQLGLVELYLVNLETEALQRVTHGKGGEAEASLPSSTIENATEGDGAAAPAFGAGGRLIAFSSSARNLIEGDGNATNDKEKGNDDVFLTEDLAAPPTPPRREVSAPPRGVRLKRRKLVVTAFSLPSGKVKLVAVAPSAGKLRVRAKAALRVGSRPRSLAGEQARAAANRPVKMILSLPPGLGRLARSKEGLYATAFVSFRSRSGKRLRDSLQVRFRVHRRQRGGR